MNASDDVRLAEVWRGAAVESVHRGRLAAVGPGGEVLLAVGAAAAPVWARSAIKPLQALPLLERGADLRLGLGARELAVISASHDGTDEHLAVVRRVLAAGGFGEADLRCGPHAPFDRSASVAIARRGDKPQPIHNNCSGKHAGFLLLARELGADPAGHLDPDGATQRAVRAAVAEMAGIDPAEIAVAVDGCGAPTLRLPLVALARAFARLVAPDGLGGPRRDACRRLLTAVGAEPVMLSGRGRISTELAASAPGRIYPKNGAEGVYAFGALTPRGPVGAAIKVSDGAERGYWPVAVALLARLGMWPSVPGPLAAFAEPPVRNTQRIVVGAVTLAPDARAALDRL